MAVPDCYKRALFQDWQNYPRNQKSYYPLKDLKKDEVLFERYFGSEPSDVYMIDVQDGRLIKRRVATNKEPLDALLLGEQPQIRIFIIPPGKMNGHSRYLLNTDDARKLFTRYEVRPTFLDLVCSAQNLELEIEKNSESKDTECSEIDKFGKCSCATTVESGQDT